MRGCPSSGVSYIWWLQLWNVITLLHVQTSWVWLAVAFAELLQVVGVDVWRLHNRMGGRKEASSGRGVLLWSLVVYIVPVQVHEGTGCTKAISSNILLAIIVFL